MLRYHVVYAHIVTCLWTCDIVMYSLFHFDLSGFVLLPLFRVQSSILEGFHVVDIQKFQRPETDVCVVDCQLHHTVSFQARQEQIPWGASIAPSFPSFEDPSAQKGVRLSTRLFEKSRITTITLTCNPSDVEFDLVTKTEGCQLTYLYQQFEIPSASAFKGKGTSCR